MHRFWMGCFGFLFAMTLWSTTGAAEDIDGVQEHPMVKRYRGQDIRWQRIENYLPFRVPVGPVTGYRAIDDWIDTEGRVTRTFYRYQGTERSYPEIYKNYLDAFTAEDFDILAQGLSDDREGTSVGSRQWSDVYWRQNPSANRARWGRWRRAPLRRGGRYVTAGAIAGPIVELDLRTHYLRDLTLFGTTYQPDNILPDVIGYIERDEISPVIAEVFDLRDVRAAQEAFLSKGHVGKIGIRVAPQIDRRLD